MTPHTAWSIGLALLFAAGAQAGPCDSPQHRAFDFWIGDWDVSGPKGKLAGHNKIKREHGGCVLHERYTTPSGFTGESLNTYDASREVWHQTWTDNGGTLLVIEGGMRDGKMVLEGQGLGPDGKRSLQRISWTPNPDGTVRQLGESQGADGAWSVVFDGRYTRKPCSSL